MGDRDGAPKKGLALGEWEGGMDAAVGSCLALGEWEGGMDAALGCREAAWTRR